MNDQIQDYVRKEIKEGLSQLPENWNTMFKRMYAHENLDKDINDVVDDMPEEKLDWALTQIQKSLQKQAL